MTCAISSSNKQGHRSGFSLIEVMVVATLTSLLLLIISSTWMGFGRMVQDTVVQSQLAAEANLALQSLQRDLGGSLPGETNGRLADGQLTGLTRAGNSRLLLCFDGAPVNGEADWMAPDIVVVYRRRGDRLLRIDRRTGTALTVADFVEDFHVTDVPRGLRVDLVLSRRGLTRNYILIASAP